MSLLSIHNVCKSYGNVKALTDFSAELDCGVYALLERKRKIDADEYSYR